MSSPLIHYRMDVEVTDAIMNVASSTKKSNFEICILAADEKDARAMAIEFYSRSGLVSSIVAGQHTVQRATVINVPGAVRTVGVTNISEVQVAPAAKPEPVLKVKAPRPPKLASKVDNTQTTVDLEKTEGPVEGATEESATITTDTAGSEGAAEESAA